MSRKKSENLKRYSTLGRLSSNTTGTFNEDSNVFNANDPVFYNRMGQFKRSLDATQTDTSNQLDSESFITTETPPKKWYKNLDKYNKSLMHSSAKHNPRHSSTNVQLNKTEESITKDLSLESDSDKLPPRRKKVNLNYVLKRKNRDSVAFKRALEDEPSTSEVAVKPSNNFDSEISSSENSYTEKIFQKRRPKNFLKIGKDLKQPSENPFKKLLEDEGSSSESVVSNAQSPHTPPAPKNTKIQEEEDDNSRDAGNFAKTNLEQSAKEINFPPEEKSLNKTKNSEIADLEETTELDYSENLLKKRKPRTLQKLGNIVSKSTEDAFKNFFDDDDSSSDTSRKKQHSMEISSRRKSNFPNEKENAPESEAITSFSRKRKSQVDLETSHNSSVTKKRSSAVSEKSLNLSHSPTMTLKYLEKSDTFTQSQKQKLRGLMSSQMSNESISKARFSKNESTTNGKVISPPVEERQDKSITESFNEGSNFKTKSPSEHSPESSHVPNKSSRNLSFVVNEQSVVSDVESEIDVESKNENTVKSMKNKSQKIIQLDNLHPLNSAQSEELVSIGSRSNRHSVSDTNIQFNSPRRSSRLNKSVEFENQLISNRLSHFIEEPQFESTRKIDSIPLRPTPRKREPIRDPRLSHTQVAGEDSEIPPRAALQSEKSVSLKQSKTPNRDFPNEKEESDYNIQAANHTLDSSPKNRSNTLSFERRSRNADRMDDLERLSKSNLKASEDIEDNQSEKSLTVSLSEGESHASKKSSERSVEESPHNISHHLSTSFNRSPQKNFAPENSNENIGKTIDSIQGQAQKPKIINYQIINPNEIDLNKLKGNKQLHTNDSEVNFERSGSNFKTFPRRPRVSTIEEEFSLIHGVEDEQVPSTSDGRTHNSQSHNVSKPLSQHNSSLKSLRRTLENEEESDYSDNPLMSYYQEDDFNDQENESNSPLTSPVAVGSKKQKTENTSVLVQKNIKDFVQPRAVAVSPKKLLIKPITDISRNLMTVSEMMKDKKKKEEFLRRIAENKSQMQKKLDSEAARSKVAAQKKIVKLVQRKEKKPPKPIHPAYLVNGKVYKQPKLPRPMPWATDRLYDYISRKIEPKYGIKTRIESGRIVNHLAEVVKKTMKVKLFKNYAEELDDIKKHMAEAGLIVNDKDFIDFCTEYLPIGFRMKATPMLIPGNKMNFPYDWSKLYTPIEF